MPLIICRAIATIALVASSMTAALGAAAPDRSVHVTIGSASIDVDAIQRLLRGIFQAAGANTGAGMMAALEGRPLLLRAKIVDTVDTPTTKMPVGFQYFYYAGRDPKTERELIWQSPATKHVCVGAPGCPPNDEFVAGYSLAAMDAYYVDGEPWRTLYKSAPDAESRLALGKAIAKAMNEVAAQAQARGIADVASIRERITIGMRRNDAYDVLRSFGLVAYNSAFNPGVPIESPRWKGCDYSDRTAAAWPYHGEPLPRRSGQCATMGSDGPGPFPSAYVDVSGGFTIACGSEASVALNFDTSDRISNVNIGKFEWTCM